MNNIPTAEEFALQDGWHKVIDHVTKTRMVEFAKLHVQAALKVASENVKVDIEIEDSFFQTNVIKIVKKDSILNSYPLTNIK